MSNLPTVLNDETLPAHRAAWRQKVVAGLAARKSLQKVTPELAAAKRKASTASVSAAEVEAEYQRLLHASNEAAHAEAQLLSLAPPMMRDVLEEREARRRALAADVIVWQSRLENCPAVKRKEFKANLAIAERDHAQVLGEIVALKKRLVDEAWPSPDEPQRERLGLKLARLTKAAYYAVLHDLPVQAVRFGTPEAAPADR